MFLVKKKTLVRCLLVTEDRGVEQLYAELTNPAIRVHVFPPLSLHYDKLNFT